jgi:hypothetical protein
MGWVRRDGLEETGWDGTGVTRLVGTGRVGMETGWDGTA